MNHPLGTAILLMCIVYGFVQWCKAAAFMIALTREYQPHINPWSRKTFFNPFNALLMTDCLTPQGREYARKCKAAMAKFLITVLLPSAAEAISTHFMGTPLFAE